MEKGTDKKDDLELWKDPISPEEKIHHEVLFFSQGPVDGYLSGDRARDIFLHSRLPLTVLSQIWNVADVSNDNVLSLEEFVLAMHLILKVKDGLPVPRRLPKHLVPVPQAQANIEDMSDIEREAYQNVFTKLNLESIDAIQGRQLLLESKLPVEELSKVWDLSDIDRNGQLDKDEWMVSCHLIRHMKKGVKLNGPVDVFKWIPQRLSSVSYQARKHRVDEYNRKKHHLMTQKEKRKTQIDSETRRLELLKKRYNLHKELFEVSKTSAELNIPEEEFLLYQEKEENNIEKVEAIVYRLKKEHEKIRQETVKVILGEQGSLQEDARFTKHEQDEVKQRLLTTHTKATKDPDPFHELYELRKELRKRSTLSEGEEPEVHFPFVSSPFDRDSIYPKYSGNTIFVQPSPSVLNNNNSNHSNHKKGEVLRDLCEFGKGFIEKWTSGKGLPVLDPSHDSVFMSLNVPMDARVWSGIRWGENMDASNLQSLHIRLVDLKEEMEKLNEDTGGQLLFRNPDDYLARKKAQEEEEKLEKSKYHRRGQSDKRKGEKDSKRRSYVAPQRDEESQQALTEYRQKRRSLNLDKNTDKAGNPDIPKRTNRRSNIDKKNKENKLTVNTNQPETFTPASASSPRPVEAAASTSKESTSLKSQNTAKSSTSPTRPSTKRKAAPPPPCSPQTTQDELDSPVKPLASVVEPTEVPKIPNQQTVPAVESKIPIQQTSSLIVEATVDSKIPKFVGVTENTQPDRPPRRKKREGNKSFLHDSFERQNSTENLKEEKQVNNDVSGLNQEIIAATKSKTVESVTNKPRDNLKSEKEDSLLDSVIKEIPSLKSQNHVNEAIVNTVVKTELETVPVQDNKAEVIIARTNDGLELEIKPESVSREKGKFKLEETQTQIELKERDTVVSKTDYIDSDSDQEVDKVSNGRTVEIEQDEPDGYLDHIKPVAFRKQAPVEDLDQAFEKIALLSYSKKSKDTRDTVSIASDISSAGSEPPPLPDSAPPSFPELLLKTPSLTEISETMEVTETREVEQAPPLFVATSDEAMNGELSPVMSPISDLKSISMRVTSPTRDRGGDVMTNGSLTIDVGENKQTLDYDSDLSDEDEPQVVGTFTPGESETKNIPTETQADDGGIQLLSYSAKLHSPNSDQSGPDSAFEDMQSSLTSNDPLSSTFDDIVQEDYVVSEKANKAETSPIIKEENIPVKVAQKSYKPQRSEFKTMPGTKDFVAKAQQFADVVQKPPNMRVKLKREISGPQDLTDAAYLKLEAERQAVISSSTMKKKGIDMTAQYNPTVKDSQIEPSAVSPDEAIHEWRSDVSKRASIDWEEKPDKVDLYSHNVIQEDQNTETVDRESIANLSTTRKQWENKFKSNDTPNPPKNKEPVKQVKHWEVKLPTKSKIVPADVVKSRVDSDSESENEGKMDATDSVNESAIEREIRLAMEREDLLRKEKEQRSQSTKPTFVKMEEENNNKPTYHEMTEADRGSELKQREDLIQQELLEQQEREQAIRGKQLQEDDSTSESSQEDVNANESIIEREIRLQQERERELELSRQQSNKPQQPFVTAKVVEEQVVEDSVKVEYSEPVRSSPTPISTPAMSTPDDLSEAEDEPTNVTGMRARISYEDAIANPAHDGESLIARELRETREREDDLARQRQRLSGTFTNNKSSPANKQSELDSVSKKLATTSTTTKSEPVVKPSYQNDVSPYKEDRRQSQDSLSSHSTEKSQPKNVTPRSNVRVTSFSDKLLFNRTSELTVSPKERRETHIEREIRLNRERENEYRVAKGLLPLEPEKKEEYEVEVKATPAEEEAAFNKKKSNFYGKSTSASNVSIQKLASSRLQKEIDKQTALEKTYRDEGKIKSTSEEHVGLVKYTEIKQDNNVPTKRNFSVNKKPVPKNEAKVEQNGAAEEKQPTPKVQTPEQKSQPNFNRTVSGGAMTFSYRESRHKAESKIEQELREMREREEELRSQRAGAGQVSPNNQDSPRSPTSNSVGNKRSHFEQTA